MRLHGNLRFLPFPFEVTATKYLTTEHEYKFWWEIMLGLNKSLTVMYSSTTKSCRKKLQITHLKFDRPSAAEWHSALASHQGPAVNLMINKVLNYF